MAPKAIASSPSIAKFLLIMFMVLVLHFINVLASQCPGESDPSKPKHSPGCR
ncbi:hypothetical protein BT93_F1866 [Corymbia citriodora subsp. variegata]|nr:hypothetical protein BT93_F1866 [Corymbia citriodora subsp. variegata]